MYLNKIKEQVLSYTSYIKELTIIIQNGYPFALVTPDFEALKRAKIINIEDEIRWYAIELYNMKADEQEKIKGYEILTTPILKTEDEPNDEIYTVLKLY